MGDDRLLGLLRERALLRGNFVLSSGKTSHFYLDCKRLTLDPEGLALLADRILDLLPDFEPLDAIGGPPIGADPIVAAVALRSFQRGRPLPAFLIRKEVKEHGTQRPIENPVREGGRVLVVEDVVTTGKSTLEAIRRCVDSRLQVAGVVCIVDRNEGGREALAPWGFRPLYTVQQVLEGA